MLAGLSLAVPVMTPMLVAVIASRATEAEHGGQGWLLHATAGVRPGTLARAKILALSLPLAVAMLAACVLPLLPCAIGAALIAALVWRVEHQGGNATALMTSPASTASILLAKTVVIRMLITVMQLVLLGTILAVGHLGFGL